MAGNQRETAQRKRAEARDRRRSQQDGSEQASGSNGVEDQSLDSIKQAAKVAAASAAFGGLLAAARALSQRHDEAGDEEEPERADDEQPSAEGDPGEDETRGSQERETEEQQQEPQQQQAPQQQQQEPQQQQQEPEQQQGPQQQQAPQEWKPQEREPERREPEEPLAGASPEEAREVVTKAREQLGALVGKEPEAVSALESTGDGWLVTLEVVEVSRIPESTDVLASYEIELDDDLNLRRYARVRRYNRSQADHGGAP